MRSITVLISLAVVVACISAVPAPSQGSKKLVCYFGSWAVYRPGDGKFDVEDIDPMICTHAMYGFAGINTDGTLKILDEYNELEENWGRGAMRRFTNMKLVNPALKTILAIGGWNEGSENYSNMAMTQAGRRKFIDSVVPFLQLYNFDGFDLDWEYPTDRGGKPEDKANFVLLCQEMREEFNKHGFILSAAVSAGTPTIEQAYDVPAISNALDFINVMAYDFHGGWETVTHHNSPMQRLDTDTGNQTTFNVKDAINFWISKGADPSKLILGMGTYGRGWLLDDPNVNGILAPASQMITAGPYTREPGILGYNEILEKFAAQQWTIVRDEILQAPYAFNGREWIGYDDVLSISNRCNYANEMGLGGGMFWSVETDDFRGKHSSESFPLLKAAHRIFLGGDIPTPPPTKPTTTDPSATTTTKVTTVGPPPDGICHAAGPIPDPDNCRIFHVCVANGDSWDMTTYTCAEGTIYDPNTHNCNWYDDVPGADEMCNDKKH